jgi:glutathione S-transferase
MQLIGMLDSPYVRRVAIAARLLGLPFAHKPISVFRSFDLFASFNPVVKAPTLVCNDGGVLMDSGLIIDYFEALAGRSLWPAVLVERVRALRITGLALAVCEKTVQIVYEHELRPEAKQHGPWLERVHGQQRAALLALDAEIALAPLATDAEGLTNAGLTAAVVWRFLQLRPDTAAAAADCPALARFAQEVERLPAFIAIPADERSDVSTAAA